ncbi:Mitochondrial dicarboxylate transporter [Cladochytrium tenue]|nr:Mitochondrial dicarboxylate transporter [Cladochytrium tenue]
MAAATVTHPLDTLKIRLQTSTVKAQFVTTFVNVIRKEGFLALYSGLSASLLRQATYSTARFGVNDFVKEKLGTDKNGKGLAGDLQSRLARAYPDQVAAAGTSLILCYLKHSNFPLTKGRVSFAKSMTAAVLGGLAGGIVGTPADIANIRMQDDGRLPPAQRRGYKNAFDGLYRIAREEGAGALLRGWAPNTGRAVLMTASQIVSYDVVKARLLESGLFQDNLVTHFTSSLTAGLIATTVTSPFDVLKTRIMTAPEGTYKGSVDAFTKIVRAEGPAAFFKGCIVLTRVPSFTRLGPHTILTFIAYERLKLTYAAYQSKRQ